MIFKISLIILTMKILLIGKAGCGKSTVARHLTQKYHLKKYSLGDGLKHMTVDILNLCNIPVKLNDLYNTTRKKQYRKYMQQIGTEISQKYFGKECWCNLLKNKIQEDKCEDYVIDDIRFNTEYKYWYDDDTISIKLIRNNAYLENTQTMESKHQSETEMETIKCDYTIINNNITLDELYNKIDNIIEESFYFEE